MELLQGAVDDRSLKMLEVVPGGLPQKNELVVADLQLLLQIGELIPLKGRLLGVLRILQLKLIRAGVELLGNAGVVEKVVGKDGQGVLFIELFTLDLRENIVDH